MISSTVEVLLRSSVSDSFRCKMAADSLDIDVQKKSVHHLKIENIKLPDEWTIGLIYGASGSGKTTLAKKVFGNNIFKAVLKENKPIIEQFPKEFNYEQCAAILTGIGLTSVVCWIRPVNTLSNGQRARAEAALLITQNELTVIDEWTSVVDRTVAKIMSQCVSKFARRQNKQIILLSCHADIIEWLKPDWILDCNRQSFQLPKSDAFFLLQKKKLNSQSEKSAERHGDILASIII